jgi:hypothetical protein
VNFVESGGRGGVPTAGEVMNKWWRSDMYINNYFSSTFVSPCTSQLALRDIEWVRYVFPVFPVIEPGFVSIGISLGMYQLNMRPSAKLLIWRRGIGISELKVIVATLDATAQPR